MKTSLKLAAIIAAATIGEGIFGLPYAFSQVGWFAALAYLVILGAVVIIAHIVYLKTLEGEGEKKRLLGLAQTYLGTTGFWTGIFAIVIGLLLALVADLVIGSRFLILAFPAVSPSVALLIYWAAITVPLFATDRRIAGLEIAGIALTSAVVLFVFGNALPHQTLAIGGPIQASNLFLPFGIMLLALAGWTGIEPAYELRKDGKAKSDGISGIVLGTILVGILYLLFISGIFGSATQITQDTISGLAGWASWKRDLVALLGLLAVTTSCLPISRELKNSLEKDMRWNPIVARLCIALIPLLAILAGFNNFFAIVGLSGGVFISLEYFLIIAVGREALPLSRSKKLGLDLLALLFIIAACYEMWSFVISWR